MLRQPCGGGLQLGAQAIESLSQRGLPAAIDRQVLGTVAGHAAHLVRPLMITLRPVVTRLATDAGEVHLRRLRRNALAADAAVEIAHRRVSGRRAVAALAGGAQCLLARRDLVANLDVAVQTLHLVVGDVHAMQELRLGIALQARRLVVTREAALARHVAVAFDHAFMAGHTVHVEPLDIAVVEGEAGRGNHLFGDRVTERAACRALVRRHILEVAQEAGRRGDGDVAALHDL
jgi:hypothetical protein